MDNVDLVIIYLQSKNAFYLKATDVEIAAAVAINYILGIGTRCPKKMRQ